MTQFIESQCKENRAKYLKMELEGMWSFQGALHVTVVTGAKYNV